MLFIALATGVRARGVSAMSKEQIKHDYSKKEIAEVAGMLGVKADVITRTIDQNPAHIEALAEATTIEEVMAVYHVSPNGSAAEQDAVAKWNSLSMEAGEKATTIEEVMAVYNTSPSESEAERAAIFKILELNRAAKQTT
jgi:hypothetical protein